MSFRKNSILFYENIILLAALSLLMIAVGLVKNFPILCLCAVPLLIVALVSPKLDREYITIDEWGISCKEGDQLRWSFDWAHIADLRRSSRVSPSLRRGDPLRCVRPAGAICFGPALFPIGRAAKKALSMYYAKPPFPRT